MKLYTKLTLILILVTSNSFAQKDYRAILEIRGGTEEFCISKDSTFWIATKTGDTYYSEGFNKPWNYGTFKTNEYDFVSGQTFERASFFNRDTGYISGFIQKDGQQDFIYWTNDGGKNWKEVKFGKSSWIDANYIDDDGNAWMSGSSQLIYYSNDFGKTWTSFDKVEPTGNMRINTIYFENIEKGVVGDFWNRIYLTKDNCKSWTKIPSPLDQQKYVRTNKNIRPTIYKAQIFGNNIIINQQDLIFWSKLDTIKWNKLSDIIDFSFDKSSKKLFAISKDLKVHLLDSNFVSNWKSESNLVSAPISLKPLNGTLYAWHRAELTKVNEREFVYTPMFTMENPIATPNVTAKATYKTWGVNGREILQSDDLGKTWYRVDLLDFNIGNFKAINDYEAIISDSYYQKYFKYKITDDSTELIKYFIENPLAEFLSNPLREVRFETGSQGCFHSNSKVIEYKLENDSTLSSSSIELQGFETDMEKYKNSFSTKVAIRILDAIDSNPYSQINVNELNISESDKNDYLKKIDLIENDFKKGNTFDYEHGTSRYNLPYNQIDFEFYKNSVNQIDSFDKAALNNILGTRYGNWSTTTNWIKITFKNIKGDEISISNFDDMPNAWYLPWIVESNGLIFPINNVDVTRFIESNTPDDFISPENKNKLAIFQMVDYLYKKRINE